METRSRSRHKSSSSNLRDIGEVFDEFRDMFADSEINDPVDDYPQNPSPREVETPAWAKNFMANQSQILRENAAQINELRQEVRSLKRKREESDREPHQWKFKGNERQFKFNLKLQQKLQDIAESNTLLDARTFAEESLVLLSERNKHIQIADQDGWDTVEIYTTDP